eukprot:PhF_6_TR22280/c0_g1_i2/m.31515
MSEKTSPSSIPLNPPKQASSEMWEIDFGKRTRRRSKKEVAAIEATTASLPNVAEGGGEVGTVVTAPSIPPVVAASREEIAQRKCLRMERWYCMVRPQYPTSCGISSLVSVWNYLYSTYGNGTLPPISQEEAMSVIGMSPPFEKVRWGPFTGNTTLMRWFHMLNKKYGCTGKAFYFYKPHGHGRTLGLDPSHALHNLKLGLQSPTCGYIYHCYNHYCCPIGYEVQPAVPAMAYAPASALPPDSNDVAATYILIGEVSGKSQPPMHIKKWDDIVLDLTTQYPQYYNIRHPERGVMRREGSKRVGGNIHCLLGFRSDVVEDVNWDDDEEVAKLEDGGDVEGPIDL